MRKSERYPGVIIEHGDFCVRLTFDPQNEMRVHGLYLWRPNKTGYEIDDILDEISRKVSRAIQRRAVA